MLKKWQRQRPTRFTDYITTPSRWDLSSLLLGNYNNGWSFQQVAEAVGAQYAKASTHLRAEMVTSQLIAHRRQKMLANMENWDTREVISRALVDAPELTATLYHYRWDEERRENFLVYPPKKIGATQ
jgi:hypothetical protein